MKVLEVIATASGLAFGIDIALKLNKGKRCRPVLEGVSGKLHALRQTLCAPHDLRIGARVVRFLILQGHSLPLLAV
eukprot:4953267-Amphidinium_carterae.1